MGSKCLVDHSFQETQTQLPPGVGQFIGWPHVHITAVTLPSQQVCVIGGKVQSVSSVQSNKPKDILEFTGKYVG